MLKNLTTPLGKSPSFAVQDDIPATCSQHAEVVHAPTRSGAGMSEPKPGQSLQRTVCSAKSEVLGTTSHGTSIHSYGHEQLYRKDDNYQTRFQVWQQKKTADISDKFTCS